MKVYVIAAMHGDEQFGLKILEYIDTHDDMIKLRIGHPEAIRRGVRYVDHDLNRSFGLQENSLEVGLAQSIQEEIVSFQPDIVIDIHTSVTAVGKVAIVAEYNKGIEATAQALGLEAIVIMAKKYTRQALIGCLPDRSISLELGCDLRSDSLARDIAQRITRMQSVKTIQAKTLLPRYKVRSIIPKNYQKLAGITNLQYDSHLQAYPFLAGPNAYQEMGGFLADKVHAEAS